MGDIFDQVAAKSPAKGAPVASGDIFDQVSASSAPHPTITANASIDAGPKGILGKASDYLNQVESDIRYGSTATIPGRILKAMGAQGLNRGVSEGAVEQVASPVLGPLHAAEGLVMTPSHPVAGALKTVGGVAQTAQIPLAIMGNAPGAAESVMGRTIPSVMKEQAANTLQRVASVANKVPVDASGDAGNIALDIYNSAARGGMRPKVINDFVRRMSDPDQGPLTYEEARDFYSNATSKLSKEQIDKLPGILKVKMAQFTSALGKAIQTGADSAGVGDQYANAMSQYAAGAQRTRAVNTAIKVGLPTTGAALLDYYIRQRLGVR